MTAFVGLLITLTAASAAIGQSNNSNDSSNVTETGRTSTPAPFENSDPQEYSDYNLTDYDEYIYDDDVPLNWGNEFANTPFLMDDESSKSHTANNKQEVMEDTNADSTHSTGYQKPYPQSTTSTWNVESSSDLDRDSGYLIVTPDLPNNSNDSSNITDIGSTSTPAPFEYSDPQEYSDHNLTDYDENDYMYDDDVPLNWENDFADDSFLIYEDSSESHTENNQQEVTENTNAESTHWTGYQKPYPQSTTTTWNIESSSGHGLDRDSSDYLIVTPGGNGEDNHEQVIMLDYEHIQSIHSPGYPQSYPKNASLLWEVNAGSGYGLEINITDVDLSPDDFLLITPKDELENRESIIFTGYLKEPRRYRILDYDSMFVHLVSSAGDGSDTAIHRGFSMDVKHIGLLLELEAATLIPTPEWVAEPHYNYTIYLSGMSPQQFVNISEDFRMILVDMVNFYIDANNIPVDYNITVEERVKYDMVTSCPVTWPNSETCISITASAPLLFNASSGEYEMTRDNLTSMWNMLSEDVFYQQAMLQLGLQVYHMPNDKAILTVWLGISVGVIAVMLITTYLIWKFNCCNKYVRMERFSDADSLASKKKSDASLFPTPHQTIPPLFGLESYDQYWLDQTPPPNYDESFMAPESSSTNLHGYKKNFAGDENLFFELDSDEEIVMSLPDNVSKASGPKIPKESTF